MANGRRGGVGQDLRTLWDGGATGPIDDGELIARFLRRDATAEAAFAALVDRHGRLVLRVCRDVLGDSHDAQDSAQATFLVLARKAASIRKPEALPNWLHGTARRVATRALRESIVRRRHERRKAALDEKSQEPESGEARTWPELHEELDRLPDRYRSAIVLCDLSGMTHEQAAGKLGCPPRTLQTRLYRGRERLRDRLIRRGVAPAGIAAGLSWAGESQAVAPPAWVASTASAALLVTGKAGWTTVPGVSARLARSYLKGMSMTKWKTIVAAGLLVGVAVGGAWSGMPREREGPPVVPAQAPEPRAASPKPAPAPSKPGTHPITITGRAVDPEGKPVANARITLASSRASYGKVAETTTDADGRYEFRDAPLPIERSKTNFGRDQGVFQVFGQADGLGYTWRPRKSLFPNRRPVNIMYPPYEFDRPSRYEPGDMIVLNLKFSRPARLAGIVVDERGNPHPKVQLEIYDCTAIAMIDNCVDCWTLDMLNNAVPDSMRVRTTDEFGRFEFKGMPADCRFRIQLTAEDAPNGTIYAATTAGPMPDHDHSPVLTGELRITMPTSVAVPVRMVYGDTGKVAARVLVQAVEGFINTSETTDENGLVTLHLPVGRYRMENWPATETPYLVTGGNLVVTSKPPSTPIVTRLDPAAFVEVTVVDAKTGAGISDVDVWREEGANVDIITDVVERRPVVVRSFEAPRLVRRDRPRTDATGKVRFPIEPGKHRLGVGKESFPPGTEVVEAGGQEVECRAAETATLKFTVRKKP